MIYLFGTLLALLGGIPLLLGGTALIAHIFMRPELGLPRMPGPHDSWRAPRLLWRRQRMRAFPRQLRA